jgi:hypothetical protein
LASIYLGPSAGNWLDTHRQHGETMVDTPSDSFDFELTDFDKAREALDEPPPGIREVEHQKPGYWEARRRRTLPSDKALTGLAIDWLIALPTDIRPKAMCDKFPRIVNQIAQWWGDRERTAEALKCLLADERGGRQGFPPDVTAELNRLLNHALRPPVNRPGNPGTL